MPIIRILVAAFFFVTLTGPLAARPNIILIVADDMGYSDIGCFGSEIRTPRLDGLAQNGTRFTHFYNTAKCWTTRASILTGLYYQQSTTDKVLNANGATIPQLLRAQGYHTLMSGKWHLGGGAETNSPLDHGFDRYYGTLHGANSFYKPYTLMREREPVDLDTLPRDFYYTTAITDQAVDYINEYSPQKESDKPFFMYVTYTAPHWPMQAPQKDIAKYQGVYDGGWDAIRDARYKKQLELGVIDSSWGMSPRDERVGAWVDSPQDLRAWNARRMETYGAMVSILDTSVGRIVDQLKVAGQLDNTLLIFFSDNGGSPEDIGYSNGFNCLGQDDIAANGKKIQIGRMENLMPGPEESFQGVGREWANVNNTPFREFKTFSHEGGISTPFIAHWPGRIQTPGQISGQVGHVIDLMATCLDAAGVGYPRKYEGRKIPPREGQSLLPAIVSAAAEPQSRELYWDFANHLAVREGDYKLVGPNAKKLVWELYDIDADRNELVDLTAQMPARAKRMAGMYDAWKARVTAKQK